MPAKRIYKVNSRNQPQKTVYVTEDRMNRKRILIFLSGLILILLAASGVVFGKWGNRSFSAKKVDAAEEVEEPTATKRVLVIGSYQLDWAPEQNMLSGIQENLEGDVLLYYYFMDTKHEDEQFSRSQLTQYLLEQESENKKYDLVMCMDEPAFQFVNDFHARFFNQIPVVFMAINNETKVQAAARAYPTTGIAQVFPLQQTVDLARTICPEATRVVVITDSTSAGKSSMTQYDELRNLFPGMELRYLITSSCTRQQLADYLESYNKETILLYANMNNDSSGHVYTMEEAIKFISEHTQIPVFCSHEYGVGMGLLGGCVISNKEMGTRAARMTKMILNGKSADDIAVETASYHYLFDARVMRIFNISKRSIPVGSEFINDQYAFFRTYWPYLVGIGVAFIFAMMSVIIIMTRKSRNQARSALNTAYEASQARNNFFSRMSHEMRTPLNAVIGYAELGHEDTVDPMAAEYFRKIYSSGKYLLSVINDVLDIGKIENDHFSLHTTVVPLGRVIRHVNEMISPLCKTHRIKYNVNILIPQYRQVICDEIRAQQVLINLLGNAVKYTQDGGQIDFTFEELSSWTTPKANETDSSSGSETATDRYGTYRIVVSDNGCGMSPDYLPHIFEAFVSSDEKNQAGRQVTGLGLAITKKIIELAHGTISVESGEGKGSTFTVLVDFPIAKDETEAEARHEARVEEAALVQNERTATASVRQTTGTAVVLKPGKVVDASSSATGSETGRKTAAGRKKKREASAHSIAADFTGQSLLLVEDNDLNADIESILFEKLGFKVTRAANGEEGYTLFSENPPHTYNIIIMDLLMPVLDGFGATELIRSLDREDAGTIPIIAMSASVQKEDHDHALQVGMNGMLNKPIDRSALLEVLRDYCSPAAHMH